MAKWGEGDPRWIVEERSDAHNVNNWHWREADATEWSKDFVKSCLTSIAIDESSCRIQFTEVTVMEGDASCCVRKGKFICLYDWEKITVKWTANVAGVETTFKGSMKIEGLDQDAEDDDISYTSSFEKSGPEHPVVKQVLRKTGPVRIWEAFQLYSQTLRADFAKKLAFVKSDSEPNNNNATPHDLDQKLKASIQLDQVAPAPAAPTKQASQTDGAKITTKCIKMTETFQGHVDDVYSAFVDINKIQAWSRGSLKTDVKGAHELQAKSTFALFGGNVSGTIASLKRSEEICMTWRLNNDKWPNNHFSNVTIKFQQDGNNCKVNLEQKQVPSERTSETTEGWKRYYFTAMKQVLGLGGMHL